MQLCDVGVWLALVQQGHVHHQPAREWIGAVSRPGDVLFCRVTQQGLLRLLTTRAVLEVYGMEPLTNSAAWDIYDGLLEDYRVGYAAGEPEGLESAWRQFSARPSPSPKLWMDAYLAAFAVASGNLLVSTDRAFRQFPDLDLLLLE